MTTVENAVSAQPLSIVSGPPLAEEPGLGTLTLPGFLREITTAYADREALVMHEAGKLSRHFDRITHCHVVIAAPQKPHRHGQRYSIHVELGVPHGPLVVDHETSGGARQQSPAPADAQRSSVHEDLYTTARDTFDIVRRRLEEHVRRLRGEIKRHASATPLEE